MAKTRLLQSMTYREGQKFSLGGAVYAGQDDAGRFLYRRDRDGHWFAVTRVPSGWVVSEYEGKCDC